MARIADEQRADLVLKEQRERTQVDDQRSDDVRDLFGVILGGELGAAHRDVGNEQRREDGADRIGGRQQRRADAVKAHGRQCGGYLRVPLCHGGQVVQARAHARQRAGKGHGQNDVALIVDARILRSMLVEAASLELVAEGGLLQHDINDDRKEDGDKDGEIIYV